MDLGFRIAVGILAVAVFLVRTPPQLRSLEATEKLRLEGKLNIASRTLAGLAGITLLVLYLVKPVWIDWAALPIPSPLRWLGAAVGAGGIAGLMWVHRGLGRNFSATLEVRAEQVLVTSGPYRWVRHPMYTTLFLIVSSFFLLSANWLIGAVWIGGLTAVVASRISNEDAAMEAKFGDSYRAWAARTGRLVPLIRRGA
jgi:protein-S-isoprenylcysteine O-methyltransferase Ste14